MASLEEPETTRQGHGSMSVLKDWHVHILLAAAVAVFFRRILTGQAYLWEDFLVQVYPFRTFAAVALANGELPLWNPYAFAGMPFQADVQSAVFYLPHLLLTVFVRDGVLPYYALEVMLIAHYWIAAVGMYALARAHALEPVYALFSAIVFAFSGFMIVHAIHPGFVEQAAWAPWIILFQRRAIERQSVRYALLAGVTVGHAVLAGAPQISLFLFLLMLGYTLFAFATHVRGRDRTGALAALLLPALAVTVAVGVAAIQLVPTMELTPLSERDTLTFEAAQMGRLAWRQLLTAVMPRYFGSSGADENSFWTGTVYGTYWETCFYWGIAGLLASGLALSRLRRNSTVLFLAAIVVMSFLFAVGDQFLLHRVLFSLVPGFSKFRAPARILLLATFAVALLAGIGLRDFVDRARRTPATVERACIVLMIAMLGVWGLTRAGLFLPPPTDSRYAPIREIATHEARMALLLAVAALVPCVLLTRRVLSPALAVASLLLIQSADMIRFGGTQNDGVRSTEAYFHTRFPGMGQLIRQFQDEGNREVFRITSRRGGTLMLDRNQGMVDGLFQTDGYSPLRLRRLVPPASTRERTLDLLNSKYRLHVDSAAGTVSMRLAPSYLPHAFLVPTVQVIPDDSAAATFMRAPTFDPLRIAVVDAPLPAELPIIPDTVPFSGHVAITEYGVNEIRLTTQSRFAAFLVLSEIHYPGWRAYVDGTTRPVARADWNLRGILIDAGTHEVVMRFEPRSFRIGAFITAFTFLAAAVLWFLTDRRPAARRI